MQFNHSEDPGDQEDHDQDDDDQPDDPEAECSEWDKNSSHWFLLLEYDDP